MAIKQTATLYTGEELVDVPADQTMRVDGWYAAVIMDITVISGAAAGVAVDIVGVDDLGNELGTYGQIASQTAAGTTRAVLVDPGAATFPLISDSFKVKFTKAGTIDDLDMTIQVESFEP